MTEIKTMIAAGDIAGAEAALAEVSKNREARLLMDADTAAAEGKVGELEAIANAPTTMPVGADISGAVAGVGHVEEVAGASEATVGIGADPTEANADIDAVAEGAYGATVELGANTAPAEGDVGAFERAQYNATVDTGADTGKAESTVSRWSNTSRETAPIVAIAYTANAEAKIRNMADGPWPKAPIDAHLRDYPSSSEIAGRIGTVRVPVDAYVRTMPRITGVRGMRFTFTDRAAPFCEVGFDDVRIEHSAGKWGVAEWDAADATWAGVEPTWRDVSCEVWEATCEYGRMALTDRFVPGVASVIVRNFTGWADPMREGMRPGRPIRFGVIHQEYGKLVKFRGFIDAVIPTYAAGFMDSVELQCIDALGEVNRVHLQPFEEPFPGDNELGHERVNATLDRSLWPALKRDIAPTSWTLIADAQGGQVADLLGRMADSVGGNVWGDVNGDIGFRPRDWQVWTEGAPVDATIGNVDPGDVCPISWQRPFDRESISTRVIMGRNAETAVQIDDPEGQLLYGIETFERTDLLTYSDPNVIDLAERTMVTRSHETAPRVRATLLDARNGDAQLDLMSTVDVFKPSHYRCRLMEWRGLVFDDRYIATAVAHRITASEWSLEMNLDRAEPYMAQGGKWGQTGWDQTLWSELSSLLAEAHTRLARLEAAS